MKYKEILKEAISGYPWESPSSDPDRYKAFYTDIEKKFAEQTKRLKNAWTVVRKSNWEVAQTLYEIVKTGSYRAVYDAYRAEYEAWEKANPGKSWQEYPFAWQGGLSTAGNPSVLLWWAKTEWGISRTELYNMLAVIEEFGYEDGSPQYDATLFTFRQLEELLPLSYEERKAVQPNWTIKEICDYKKFLKIGVRTCGQEQEETAEQIDVAECVTDESAQKPDLGKWAKWSKAQLCKRVAELEQENAKRLEIIDRQYEEIEALKALCKAHKINTKNLGSAPVLSGLSEADLDSITGGQAT